MNETMGAIIAQLRKEKGMTQEQLANKLGISYQAVSKWETGISSPDISTLPLLAEIFGVNIDELFGREWKASEEVSNVGAEQENTEEENIKLPWSDDDTLHVVLFVGHRLVGHDSAGDRLFSKKQIEFQYEGPALNIQSDFAVSCDAVQGNVTAGTNVQCDAVYGDVNAGGDVTCDDVYGNVSAGKSVTCDDVQGCVTAGMNVTCDEVHGSATAGLGVKSDEGFVLSTNEGFSFHAKW